MCYGNDLLPRPTDQSVQTVIQQSILLIYLAFPASVCCLHTVECRGLHFSVVSSRKLFGCPSGTPSRKITCHDTNLDITGVADLFGCTT